MTSELNDLLDDLYSLRRKVETMIDREERRDVLYNALKDMADPNFKWQTMSGMSPESWAPKMLVWPVSA